MVKFMNHYCIGLFSTVFVDITCQLVCLIFFYNCIVELAVGTFKVVIRFVNDLILLLCYYFTQIVYLDILKSILVAICDPAMLCFPF